MNRTIVTIVCAGSILIAACTGTDSPQMTGAELAAAKGCVACHGKDGIGVAPTFPNLAGQWESYLQLQLEGYRDGTRVNQIMNQQAAKLTDSEIRALSTYYAEL